MNWQQILAKYHYPTTAVTLDFETFFSKDYSLKDLSIIEYVCDDRFEFTGLGMNIAGQPFQDSTNCMFYTPEWITSIIEQLQRNYSKNLEGCTLVGQNLMFDAMILREKFGITPKFTIDTLNLARHEDSRRPNKLEKLCEYYDVGVQKGDNKWAKGLQWSDMSPTQQNKHAEYCRGDIIATTKLFRFLLPLLTNPSVELPLQAHTLEMFLIPQFEFDFELAKTIIEDMQIELIEAFDKVQWIFDKYKTKKHKTLIEVIRSAQFVKALASVLPAGETVGMKAGKRGNIPALAQNDLFFQQLLVHPVAIVRELALARKAAKSWPTWIKRVESMRRQAELRGGKLACPLNYYGGHTGRDSGCQNVNMQNLPGRGRAGAGTPEVLQKIRNLLRAPICPTCNETGQCKDPKAGNSHMLTLMECPNCQ